MILFTPLSRLLGVVLPWLLLVGCMQSNPSSSFTKDTSPALFSDSDVDGAQLEIASRVASLEGSEEGPLSRGTELSFLPESRSDITTQAVLPDTSGFVYYLQHDPSSTAEPFAVFRFDQHNDVNTKIYAGKREIQAVAGSGDGTVLTLSMRETTLPTSDFEIFRFLVTIRRTQRLTNNTVDDTNISMSSDALKVVWEQPVSGKATVLVRSYASSRAQTNFTEFFLNRTEAQRQPSLSGNGRFIALIRDLSGGQMNVFRFDLVTNKYAPIATASLIPLEHPSISNSGRRVAWLLNDNTDEIILRDIETNTIQTGVGPLDALEHPFLSADGVFVTYGQVENGAMKVFTKNLQTNQELKATDPVSPANHRGMSWQMPFASQQKVIPINEPTDTFGFDVAVSGSYMVVDGFGHAHILSRNALGEWAVLKNLISSSFSVAISGDTAVVGTLNVTYIFERNQGGFNNWGEAKKLFASDGDSLFGNAVAISGDLVAVGGREQVFIFGRNQGGPNNWGEIKIITNSDRDPNDFPGLTIALEGDTLVMGTPRRNLDTNNDGRKEGQVGAAYIFQKDQGGVNNWGEVKKLTASDFADFDLFGSDVAISGDVVVIGAEFEDHDTNNDGSDELTVGAAYLFERNQGGTDNWGEVKKLVAGDGAFFDVFGTSVAISGDVVVIGAEFEDHDTTKDGIDELDVGAAYIFSRNQGGSNNWGELRKLVAADGTARDTYGGAVAVSGKTVVVGSPNNDNSNGADAGAVYIDER